MEVEKLFELLCKKQGEIRVEIYSKYRKKRVSLANREKHTLKRDSLIGRWLEEKLPQRDRDNHIVVKVIFQEEEYYGWKVGLIYPDPIIFYCFISDLDIVVAEENNLVSWEE